jgi:hypothetical protein
VATVNQTFTEAFQFTESLLLNGENSHPGSETITFGDTFTKFVVGSFEWQYPFTVEIRDTRTHATILNYTGPNGSLLQ